MKQTDGPDLTLLGSGTIVAQLAEAELLDEIQLLVVPIILGAGKSMFHDVAGRPWWTFTKSKAFKNGRVFLSYAKG